jgi:tetratricopeptide (TPR) repeat protein
MRGQPYSEATTPVPVEAGASADEIDLVEQMSTQRQAYRRSLETLIHHYDAAGNNTKLTWARSELQALDRIPQYRYIIDAQVLSPDLKATARIQAADDLYAEAMQTEKKAGLLPVLKDEEILRVAVGQYSNLIRQYPTSDKIDDVAYRLGGIHEYFGDYTIALSYYQRAYQWDPSTPHPARYKAALLLDNKLHRRAEALELYQEALVKEGQNSEVNKPYVERRIKELNRSDRGAQ